MAGSFQPATSDAAGQVAIVQGVDSNVYQTADETGALVHHPAAFTALEASFGRIARGRLPDDASDLRAFGRVVAYEPLGPHFESRTARGGLAYLSSFRLDRRTTLVTTVFAGVGSLQAARATDGAPITIDPVSTRRVAWNGGATETFTVELSERTRIAVLSGVDAAGTISETIPSEGRTVHRGLDLLVTRGRVSVVHGLDRRTFFDVALEGERTHFGYTLEDGAPSGPSRGPIDGADATATSALTRFFSRDTTGTGAVGVTFALPELGDSATVLPFAAAQLVHVAPTWSSVASASYRYRVAQARLGPGPAAGIGFELLGKPLSGRSRDALDVVLTLLGERSGVIVGTNDGAAVTTGTAAVMLRWAFAGAFGLLAGYDFRATRLSPASDGAAITYVRHLGFVGLSLAWSTPGPVSAMPTLARPSPAPFSQM